MHATVNNAFTRIFPLSHRTVTGTVNCVLKNCCTFHIQTLTRGHIYVHP